MLKIVLLLFSISCLVVYGQKPEPKEYVVIQKEANWYSAIDFCHRIRMQPAVISSAQQQRQIEETVAASPDPNPDNLLGMKSFYWIGGSKLSNKKNYIWEPTGQPFSFTKWEANQPSWKYNCVALGYSASTLERGQWLTSDCDSALKQFVCEVSPK